MLYLNEIRFSIKICSFSVYTKAFEKDIKQFCFDLLPGIFLILSLACQNNEKVTGGVSIWKNHDTITILLAQAVTEKAPTPNQIYIKI